MAPSRLLAVLLVVLATPAHAARIEDRLAEALRDVDPGPRSAGVLAERVVPVVDFERFDGGPHAPAASRREWLQLHHQLANASSAPVLRPTAAELVERARTRRDAIPVALLFDRYDHLRADAIERGALSIRDGRLAVEAASAFERRTAFAAAALRERTWRGARTAFVLDSRSFFSNAGVELARITVDFDDDRGARAVSFDVPVEVHYAAAGRKLIRLEARTVNGEILHAAFAFEVEALATPTPDDTLHVTGGVPYLGGVGSGDAYVYLAAGHSALVNPVVVVEGFDLDNSMDWDELYALLNRENLLERLRADGYDAVVLNFADATDYVQRNAFVLVALLDQLRATVPPPTTIALAGASMGGLVSRYALAYLESHNLPHSVRTFISFDAPQLGADIPLGIQYWIKFFSGQSADAAFLLSRLDRPASRQMLVYHYTDPPTSFGQADPLRGTLASELAALGDYPNLPRRVAIANGSGQGQGEPFVAGDQLILYTYSNFLVTIVGNVWAVPDAASHTVFDGRFRVLISDTRQTVTVSNTAPYDGAPGGWRATMTQMDTVAAPYGDIVALHPHHCFIPTTSALGHDSPDLFHDVASDPDPAAHTPFDAVYAPASNQEHVLVTAENAAWIIGEVERGTTAVPPADDAPAVRLEPPAPNPTTGAIRFAFELPRAGAVDLRVIDVGGREVARIASGTFPAGPHGFQWSGRDRAGEPLPAGIYFARLSAGGRVAMRRVVRLR
jgi:hypothetical protein